MTMSHSSDPAALYSRTMRALPALLLCSFFLPGAPPPERLRAREYSYTLPPEAAGAPMAQWLEWYAADQALLTRRFESPASAAYLQVMQRFHQTWLDALSKRDFSKLDQAARVEAVAFRHALESELAQLALDQRRLEEIGPLLPFAPALTGLWAARQRVDPMKAAEAAETLDRAARQIAGLEKELPNIKLKPTAGLRAANTVGALRDLMKRWREFYDGYDPQFSWWTASPYAKLDKALEGYAAQVREKVAGLRKDDRDTILGDPIGREALLTELRSALIPYTPEELIGIAQKEFAWCDQEMFKASRELGFGDDWRKAVEHVKNLNVEPGRQTDLVRDLAEEAVAWIEQRNLITIPDLAKAAWRMQMMSPERQRLNPYFLGGESIIVSYPTSTMTQEEKRMAMRGNNIHFSRSTVFHELIPGHWLQQYMTTRHRTWRRALGTPFWTEGWALYWEMILWDMGFPRGPEDRIGMLYWRMHRCARIIFSLSFHLEKMTAQECVRFLIDRCAQEPDNAAAEVRRSFEGTYGPLYQIAYMIGALQFRALASEAVRPGRMSVRDFHDAVLHRGRLPVELLRAELLDLPLTFDYRTQWRFYPGVR